MANEIIDYGPMAALIGVWKGDKGLDVAPEPDGSENSPYFETITYTAAGTVSNAESQLLSVLHYRQIVRRKSDQEIFHDQTGYWMWDAKENIIMQSLVIPRAVCVLAGAAYSGRKDENNNMIIEVSASLNDKAWNILQSPFMQKNARTSLFRHTITIGKRKMSYSETTMLEIYGKEFTHTDENELMLQ